MKKLLLFLATASVAAAQAAGTITVTSSTTITAVAGTVTCVFANQTPQTPGGVNVVCTSGSGGATSTQSGTIPLSPNSGVVGSFVASSNNVTWVLTEAVFPGPVTYSIVASASGATAVTKNGTF